MASLQIQIQQTFTIEHCFKCGAAFAVPEHVQVGWQQRGTTFYCPNGHVQHYAESLEAKLKKAQEELARTRQFLDSERNAHRQTNINFKATQTRLKNIKKRVSVGTCPCCQRTFKQLAAHMKNKHPEYGNVKET